MVQTLGGNAALAKRLAASDYRILITGSLLPDAQTHSGYRWTTSQGPGGQIESGTLCGVTIIVDRKRPISLLIPYLKEKLGV
jgi:HlyD family secretion protein